MEVEIKYKPSFATLFVRLVKGSSIVAESDAMVSMTPNVDIQTRMNGNFISALLRKFFGNESFFINEFSLKNGAEGKLVLSQPVPGDIVEINLENSSMYLQPGAYIASEPTVKLNLSWAGFKSWWSGEGLFRLMVNGTGKVWLGGYGGVFSKEVDGEYIVDTGHLLAYEPTMALNIGLAAGVFSSFFGGEGFVSKMQGKGKILLQSRSIDGLASWTRGQI